MLNRYGGAKMLYANDIALVEMNQELFITANVMPICVDWRNSLPPLNSGDEGIVSNASADALGNMLCSKTNVATRGWKHWVPKKSC